MLANMFRGKTTRRYTAEDFLLEFIPPEPTADIQRILDVLISMSDNPEAAPTSYVPPP